MRARALCRDERRLAVRLGEGETVFWLLRAVGAISSDVDVGDGKK